MKYIADTLYIEKFRKFKDQRIQLGKKITVFSGQNGVGKSNLLSLIATTFGTKDKRGSGGNFFPEFSDYFIINPDESFKDYKSHLKVMINDNVDHFIQKRHGYKDSRKENRGIRVLPRSSNFFDQLNDSTNNLPEISGDKKIPVPTVFLSLSRLFPIGETKISYKNIRSDNRNFTNDVFKKYIEWYNYVLPNSISESIDSPRLIHKNVVRNANLHINLKDASHETQSVGQDNLGCIISALIDFYMLKSSLQEEYIGGILCIDEVDASLHPSAQLQLFRLLIEVGEELSLQIFLSTHSLTILKEVLRLKSKESDKYQLTYIVDPVEPRVSSITTYEELKADLFDQTHYFRPKIKVYCEDDMTNFILKELLSQKTLQLLDINLELPDYEILPVHLGCNNLKDLSKYDSHFEKVVIILDGDAKTDQTHLLDKYIKNESMKGYNGKSLPKNCFTLPTYLAPESYLYYILHSLVNDSNYKDFWIQLDHIPEARLYTKNKVINQILNQVKIDSDTSNDILKTESISNSLREFFNKTQALSYYYSKDEKKKELMEFFENCKKVFNLVNCKIKASL